MSIEQAIIEVLNVIENLDIKPTQKNVYILNMVNDLLSQCINVIEKNKAEAERNAEENGKEKKEDDEKCS